MTSNTVAPARAIVTAIRARDFVQRTDDVNRDVWTVGKLRYVAAALGDTPIAIVLDKGTGHAIIGAKIVGTWSEGPIIDDGYSARPVRHRWYNIGDTIFPLTTDDASVAGPKWDAGDAWRKDASEAVRRAQAAHGEIEGRAWGRWTANVDTAVPGRSVTVRYEPITTNPFFADQWGTRGIWTIGIAD